MYSVIVALMNQDSISDLGGIIIKYTAKMRSS